MGYEKFVMDADQAQMMQVFLGGIDLSENSQGLDAIREVGPGSHFLGSAHTRANFETAFYRSPVADNNSYEQWESEGGLDCAERANRLWKKMLAGYEAPPIDEGIDEALQAFHGWAQSVSARHELLTRTAVACPVHAMSRGCCFGALLARISHQVAKRGRGDVRASACFASLVCIRKANASQGAQAYP